MLVYWRNWLSSGNNANKATYVIIFPYPIPIPRGAYLLMSYNIVFLHHFCLVFFFRSTSFHSSSLIIPGHMTVHAALISSPALRANSLVLGTVPTLGFDVARFINKYQVSHYTDLDLSSWPHQMLTESCEVLSMDLNSLPKKPLKVGEKINKRTLPLNTVKL